LFFVFSKRDIDLIALLSYLLGHKVISQKIFKQPCSGYERLPTFVVAKRATGRGRGEDKGKKERRKEKNNSQRNGER
jgi:hypothetical protein